MVDLPRCEAWVLAVLGAWSLGASVVPLDPRWPEARRRTVVRRVGSRVGVGRPLPGAGLRWVGPGAGPSPAPLAFSADREAWVCFSSGSSGRPKGVVVGFAGVPGLVRAQRRAFGLQEGLRVGWALSPGFDASFSDVLTALDAGALPVCAPPGLLARPPQLIGWLRQTAVACVDLPPALLPHLDPRALPASLRTVVVGGEVADEAAIRAWARHVRVVSVYGPTEATVCTHVAAVDPTSWRRAALGRPIPGVADAVVQAGRRCAPGEAGELWLAGPGLARGYLDAPDQTADRFGVADLGDGPRRWYRTRDRVVRTPTGLVFLGRLDREVKVGGQLVALPEVEAALGRLAGARAAAVVVVAGRLVGVLEGPAMASSAAQAELHRWLPPGLVPTRLEWVGRLPRGTSGKVDLDTLRAQLRHDGEPVGTDTELGRICRVWSRVLGRAVGPDDRLAELGRDSLATLEVHAQLRAAGVGRALAAVAEADTPRALSGADLEGYAVEDVADRIPPRSLRPAVAAASRAGATGDRLVVLGATGFIGSAVVAEWCADPHRPGVTVLVRGPDRATAEARVSAALARVPGSTARPRPDPLATGQVEVLVGDLLRPRLGLDPGAWTALSRRARLIVDLAGKVSLAADLDTLVAAQLRPVHGVAAFAAAAGGIGVVHAGTLSVFVERLPRRPQVVVDGAPLPTRGRLGSAYAVSKWLAERAWDHLAPGPLRVLRLGLVVGDTRTGAPAPGSQLAGLLRTLAGADGLPGVAPGAAVNLTPRDLAAAAIVAEIEACWAGFEHRSPARHIVQPRCATLEELRAAVRDAARARAGPHRLAATLDDPGATAFLSTGVRFVAGDARPPALVAMPDAAWTAYLGRLVRAALGEMPLAGEPPTGEFGGPR